jgi:hypothetical protein
MESFLKAIVIVKNHKDPFFDYAVSHPSIQGDPTAINQRIIYLYLHRNAQDSISNYYPLYEVEKM